MMIKQGDVLVLWNGELAEVWAMDDKNKFSWLLTEHLFSTYPIPRFIEKKLVKKVTRYNLGAL